MHVPLVTALRRAALTLAVAATLAPLFAPPPAKAADLTGFYTDFASEELMRLTNLDRRALGKSSLKVDQFLVSLARDREFKCPSNGSTYRGRARDMAVRDYMSHSVKGCRKKNGSPFTIQTILRKHGYSTYTGENIGVNNWPDTGATYKYGCSSSGTSCRGRTPSPAPVAAVQKMWMRSSGHRANILNWRYDRFGCAAWEGSGDKKFFACIFARGGPKKIDTAYPTVSSVSDNTASLRKGESINLQASFADGFRLSDGWVSLDGVWKRGWSWNVDVAAATQTFAVDPATLATGSHTVIWAVRDVAGHVTRRSATFEVTR